MLFIHQATSNWRKGYDQLVKAYKEGKIRAIGISNFEKHINEVLDEYDVKPQVIQVECHPFYPQDELRKITEKADIRIMSWYPLGGKGNTKELLDSEIVKEIALKHNKSTAQVVLKWHNQMGFITIPGSKNVDHIKDNIDIFDFELDKEDMEEMAKLNIGKRRYEADDNRVEEYALWQPTYEKE